MVQILNTSQLLIPSRHFTKLTFPDNKKKKQKKKKNKRFRILRFFRTFFIDPK